MTSDTSKNRGGTVPAELDGRPIDGAVRTLTGLSWAEARRLVTTGKVRVGGALVTDPLKRVRGGDLVEINPSAPRPRALRLRELSEHLLVYMDRAVVVVRKPAGIETVPYEGGDGSETLDALVREVCAKKDRLHGRAPLGVVQRLDKPTTGLVVFARTFAAKKHLGLQLRHHTMLRRYIAICHGDVATTTFRSHLVADRGDRLRGSAERSRARGFSAEGGQLAVTHVEALEQLRGATLVRCRLETGRTHQIRIHLAEAGHPLLGERVYIRDFAGPMLDAPRVMLHAAELGFVHPVTERELRFEDPPPDDFARVLERLRRAAPEASSGSGSGSGSGKRPTSPSRARR